MAKKVEKTNDAAPVKEVSRMQIKYKEEVVPALIKTFGYKTVMEVPKVEKIVLNMRFGDIKDNSKSMQLATEELRSELQSPRRSAGRRHGHSPQRQNVVLLRQARIHRSSPRT